jgi:RNA polymerase sigma-70 factor (ECF subfamily)
VEQATDFSQHAIRTSVTLLSRLREGHDTRSWSEFVRVYQAIVHRWLAKQGLPPHDADDVVQEVMVFVCRDIARFVHNGRLGAFRAWLRMITANRLRDFWRKQKRAARDGPSLGKIADQLADHQSDASRIWCQEYDRYLVDRLLAHVAPRFNETSLQAFRMVVLEGQHAQHVAEKLCISLGAVRMAQSRVLRALRQLDKGLLE